MNNRFFHIKLLVRFHVLLFFLLILSFRSMAQTGAEHYEKGEYALAIAEFENELDKKPGKEEQARISAYMGMCYHHINKPREAISWLKKGINNNFRSAEAYCLYGLSLQKMENYAEALTAFQECIQMDNDYPNVKLYIESCNYALRNTNPNTHIIVRSSKRANTDGSEYGISPGANGKIFFSRAPVKGNIDPRTGMAFTEVYVSSMDGNDLSKPKKEKAFMKAFSNTGVFAYDAKTNSIYMTICDRKSGKCGIYKSEYKRKNWATPEPFFTNDQFDMAHPALAKDGNRLYFVSNAPGGFGKTDIWYADRISDNKWTDPINAGPNINTPGREEFPFIEGDSLIYFSSDGHPGFGGLDIFVAVVDGDQIGRPMNIGRPFNGGADDFNLMTEGKNGLLISARNLRSSDDIYIFNKSSIPRLERTWELEEQKTEIAALEPDPEYIPIPTYVPIVASIPISTSTPSGSVADTPVTSTPSTLVADIPTTSTPIASAPVIPDPNPQTGSIITIYFDFGKFVPQREFRHIYDEIAARMKAYPNEKFEIAGHADERGKATYNDELSNKRAEYIAARLMDRGIPEENIIRRGYGISKLAIPNAQSEEDHQKNSRVEVRIIGNDVNDES